MADTSPNNLMLLSVDETAVAEPSRKRSSKKMKKASRLSRLHVRAPEGAEIVAVSLATWNRLDSSGAIPGGMKLAGCKVWSVRSLKLWSRWGCPNRREFVERLAEFEAEEVRRATRKGGRT